MTRLRSGSRSFLAALLIAGFGSACTSVDAGTGGKDASTLTSDESADSGQDAVVDAPSAACPAGQHTCSGECVADDSVQTCGSSCTPCDAPTNGVATCDGISCGGACLDGQQLCHGQCIDANLTCCSPGGCAGSVAACNGTCQANGTCLYPSGASCGASSCSGLDVVDPGVCSSTGACVFPSAHVCFGDFACSGTTCEGSCASPSDCASGFTCSISGSTSTCIPKCTSAASCPTPAACQVAVCTTSTGLCSTQNAADNIACGTGLLCSSGSCNLPVFTALPPNTEAIGVSSDGTVVAGIIINGGSASTFRWTRDGFVPLEIPPGFNNCFMGAVSPDGNFALGGCDSSPVRWPGTAAPVVFGVPVTDNTGSFVASSTTGTLMTGGVSNNTIATYHTSLWATGNPATTISEPAGSQGSSSTGMSADGSVIVGIFTDVSGNFQGFRWTSSTGMSTRVPLLAGMTLSSAVAVSADGNKVLIRTDNNFSYIWNVPGGVTALTTLPPGFSATAMSADGTTVVGTTPTNGLSLWVNGTVTTLSAKLASLGGDSGPLALNVPTGLSANGKTIIGYGFNAATQVNYQGWIVVTP